MSDSYSKYAAAIAATSISAIGWAVYIERRVEYIQATQSDRGPVIESLSKNVDEVRRLCTDPSPKPETRIAVDGLRADVDRLDGRLNRTEDRLNAFHNYLMALPMRPAPFKTDRRGDIDLPALKAN